MSTESSSHGTVRRKKPSANDPLPRDRLPQQLQDLVDDEETLLDQLYDGTYVARVPVHSMYDFSFKDDF